MNGSVETERMLREYAIRLQDWSYVYRECAHQSGDEFNGGIAEGFERALWLLKEKGLLPDE